MKDGYVFHCSFCKFDHAGECVEKVVIGYNVEAHQETTSDVLKGLDALIKALNAGSYNAKPSTLHQCSQNPPCGCGVRVDPDDPSTLLVTWTIQLVEPLRFYYLDGI